jgi:saposin
MVSPALDQLKEKYPLIQAHLQSAIDNYNEEQLKNVQEKPTCALCEFVITQLDNALGDNATETEIKNEVERACDYLPKTIRDECKGFVEQYGNLVIQYLVERMEPREICINLNLCDPPTPVESNLDYPMELNMMDKCQLCILVSDYLSEFLKDPKVDVKIEKLIEKICPRLPQKYVTECTHLIEDYGAYLISLLAQETDKGKACIQVQLCPAA